MLFKFKTSTDYSNVTYSDFADVLRHRRSTKPKYMTDPGPKGKVLDDILKIAARVPDHGKLAPFYFIVFEGDARAEFGKLLRDTYAKDHRDATEEQLDHEENRFMRAPVIVAVISRVRNAKIPAWEQMMSAGACCYNLCLAANSHGFGTNWLSEWYSYHTDIRKALGLEEGRDNIAGFIYIGTATEKQDDRNRPKMEEITNFWTSHNTADKKGDIYNKNGLGRPNDGFNLTQSETET